MLLKAQRAFKVINDAAYQRTTFCFALPAKYARRHFGKAPLNLQLTSISSISVTFQGYYNIFYTFCISVI